MAIDSGHGLFGRHAERAVKADGFAVEHGLRADGGDELGEFFGLAEALGEEDGLRKRLLHLGEKPAIMGVRKRPGAMVTTRIPKRASSRAAGSVRPATPALEAA